jgi:hypothetical protein
MTAAEAHAADLRPVEWCLPNSPAQRWLEAHGYREVEWKRFHPGEMEGWVKPPQSRERTDVDTRTKGQVGRRIGERAVAGMLPASPF